MSTRLTAVPTEYKGIVYRSKCEAMFARWIELSMSIGCGCNLSGHHIDVSGFVYEPEHLEVDGWRPDFLVWSVHGGQDYSIHLLKDAIEYKPSRPTKTYIATFRKRTAKLAEEGMINSARLFFGSVFNSERGCLFGGNAPEGMLGISSHDWIGGFESEMRSYRYDLVQADA